MKKSFASDNYSGVHPQIIEALINTNHGHVPAYGEDVYTESAIAKFKEHFGCDIDVYFVFLGTGANVLGLQAITRPYEAVICSDCAHIHTDECGAPDRFGPKLLYVPNKSGKVSIEEVKQFLFMKGIEHHIQPKVISITQATELGTVYYLEEIRSICNFAHDNDMYVHMDGARLANAAVSLGVTLKDITKGAGVDILSFGGTKNGMMYGEAVIFFNTQLSQDFKYIRKQGMQLASKMRFIAAQFEALLSNDLWEKNAKHTNEMARYLAELLADVPQIEITNKIESNAVFAVVPEAIIPKLQSEYSFYVWNPSESLVRWMTSFDTTKEDVEAFVALVKKYV